MDSIGMIMALWDTAMMTAGAVSLVVIASKKCKCR